MGGRRQKERANMSKPKVLISKSSPPLMSEMVRIYCDLQGKRYYQATWVLKSQAKDFQLKPVTHEEQTIV